LRMFYLLGEIRSQRIHHPGAARSLAPLNLCMSSKDNNGIYRIVDCKDMYNLATSSLSGVGTYTVGATIGSTTFTIGMFDLK
jgi:hypothetical protein